MKRSFLILVLLILAGVILAETKDNITNVQNRLKAAGFYEGNASGILDRETAIALSRFQMRHGLAASGKLDAATARALNASAHKPAPTPQVLTGSWQRLPNGEMQFVEERPAPAAPAGPPMLASPAPTAQSAGASPTPVAPVISASPTSRPTPQLPAAPPAEGPPAVAAAAQPPAPPSPAPTHRSASGTEIESPDRLREYVESFVQAGLDQTAVRETNFFADRVDYFGTAGVPWEQVRRDLLRYDTKWPHRRFWIDGDIQIEQQRGSNEIKLLFPLRYELRNGSRNASGKVLKSLTVVKGANNELQITAVNEWKAP